MGKKEKERKERKGRFTFMAMPLRQHLHRGPQKRATTFVHNFANCAECASGRILKSVNNRWRHGQKQSGTFFWPTHL